ncbi:MAG: amidohydrolase family protein [Pseudomonadota bacterium]
MPPEEHVLATARNAELLFNCGFTSVYAAAACKVRLDVVVRNEINAGHIKGPRVRAASPEITVTAGLGDERRMHQYRDSFALIADGCDEVRRVCRMCIREGVDNLKINISGDDFIPHAKGEITTMSDAEVATACEVAHDFNRQIAAHCRSAESVKRAARNGVDVIYHCESCDDEALDMLEARKDNVFVGPAVGLIHNVVFEGEQYGMSEDVVEFMGFKRGYENYCKTYEQIRKRGIRAVVGGDYGFCFTPQGTNARDIGHFVRIFGYSPMEALQAATKIGGELMDMGDELGQVRAGFLADLLLIDGDPLKDLDILVGGERMAMIMKDGTIHKDPSAYAAQTQIAAE